jgi:hypothetical protein
MQKTAKGTPAFNAMRLHQPAAPPLPGADKIIDFKGSR